MSITLSSIPSYPNLREGRPNGPVRAQQFEAGQVVKTATAGLAPKRFEDTTIAQFARLQAESAQLVSRLLADSPIKAQPQTGPTALQSPDAAVRAALMKYEEAYRRVR